jgi:hypothetical protein
LRTQEDKHSALRREIAKLENQSQKSTTITSETALNTQVFEHQNTAKIAEDEDKIKTLEQETLALDHDTEIKKKVLADRKQSVQKQDEKTRNILIAKKEQEEKEDSQIIAKIKDEIRQKTLELKAAEDEDKKLQQEILRLKNQPKDSETTKMHEQSELEIIKQQNVAQTAKNRTNIENLRKEILKLGQNSEAKKQVAEKARKDFLVVKNQVEEHQRLIQEKTEEAILAVNRINGINDDIKHIQEIIKTLEK